jgi:hypothetical protein
LGAPAGRRGDGAARAFHEGCRAELIAYAEAQFALSAPQADGSTLRDLLAAMAAGGGPVDPRLAQTPPAESGALWITYLGITCGGARPVMLAEVVAWQAANGIRMTSWEVDTLLLLDRAMLRAERRQRR